MSRDSGQFRKSKNMDSSELQRKRMSSIITKQMVQDNKSSFKNIGHIKAYKKHFSGILESYQTKYLNIEKDFVRCLHIDELDTFIGMAGKLYYFSYSASSEGEISKKNLDIVKLSDFDGLMQNIKMNYIKHKDSHILILYNKEYFQAFEINRDLNTNRLTLTHISDLIHIFDSKSEKDFLKNTKGFDGNYCWFTKSYDQKNFKYGTGEVDSQLFPELKGKVRLIRFSESKRSICFLCDLGDTHFCEKFHIYVLEDTIQKESRNTFVRSTYYNSKILKNKTCDFILRSTSTSGLKNYDDDKMLIVGTKLGQIIIYDLRFSNRFFIINTHDFAIVKLVVKRDDQGERAVEYENQLYVVAVSRDKRISQTMIMDLSKKKTIDINSQNDPGLKKNIIIADDEISNTNPQLHILNYNHENYKKYVIEIQNNEPFKLSDSPDNPKRGKLQKNNKEGKDSKILTKVFKLNDKFLLSFQTQESILELQDRTVEIPQSFHSIVKLNENIFLCANHSTSPFILDISKEGAIKQIDKIKHEDNISAVVCTHKTGSYSDKNTHSYIITGDSNGVIKIWKPEKIDSANYTEDFKLIQTFVHPITHERQITGLCISEKSRIFVSTAYDKTIKIWKIKSFPKEIREIKLKNKLEKMKNFQNNEVHEDEINDENSQDRKDTEKQLIHTITGLSEIARFIQFISNQNYFMTCSSFGNFNLWSVQTYTSILSLNLDMRIEYIKLTDSVIIYSDGNIATYMNYLINDKEDSNNSNNTEFFGKNALEDYNILGPKMENLYEAMKYFMNLINKKNPDFNPELDKFVILPELLTPQHIYAYYNMHEHLALSLENKVSMNETTSKHSIITISVLKDHKECLSVICKFIKRNIISNHFLINFISDTALIEINSMNSDSISNFYNILFQRVDRISHQRFVKLSLNLPLIIKRPDPGFNFEDLGIMFKDEKGDSGKSVVYKRSIIPVTLIMGSQRSLDLLQSIKSCSNEKIFLSKFIQVYIDIKKPVTQQLMFFYAGLYIAYLLFLVAFLLMSTVSTFVFAMIFILSFMIMGFEVIKYSSHTRNKREYFSNPWNIIDFVRIVIMIVLFFLLILEYVIKVQIELLTFIRFVFFGVSMISFFRGLSLFRLFDNTGYFTTLLSKIIQNSYPFMIFMTYLFIGIGFLFYISSLFSQDIATSIEFGFLAVYGSYSPSPKDSYLTWCVYVGGFILNNWMILNFMIAVYSDTFNKVESQREIYVYKNWAEVEYDVESLMIWRRLYKLKENHKYIEHPDTEQEYILHKPKRTFCKRKNNAGNSEGDFSEENKDDLNEVNFYKKEYLHTCEGSDALFDSDLLINRIKAAKVKSKKASQTIKKINRKQKKIIKIQKNNSIIEALRGKSSTEGLNEQVDSGKEELRDLAIDVFSDFIICLFSNDVKEKKIYKEKIENGISNLLSEN